MAAVLAAAILYSGVISILLSGCSRSSGHTGGESSQGDYASGEIFAMDTYMTWDIPEDREAEISEGLKAIITKTENLLSVTDEGSELYQLNAHSGETVTLSPELLQLLERCLELAEETDGALNPALYPLVKAWGFTTGEHRVPGEEERRQLLANTDWRTIEVNETGVTLPAQMELDFGAVGKGYLTDRCVSYLKEIGIESALLKLGGNVYAFGSKFDGSDWRIGVELPFSDGDLAGVLTVRDLAVITSGNYQRYFEQDGKLYHHIMDGRTGAPAESGLNSVTIVAPDGVTADALSTAYFVMGLEASAEDWRSRENLEVIWITDEEKVYYTEGLAACFTVSEGLDSEMIKR